MTGRPLDNRHTIRLTEANENYIQDLWQDNPGFELNNLINMLIDNIRFAGKIIHVEAVTMKRGRGP